MYKISGSGNFFKCNNDEEIAVSLQEFDGLNLKMLFGFCFQSSVILSAESADDIKVYVVPDVRYLITEDGVDAEFKADKTYKGKIFPDEQYFKFILTDS